MLEKSVSGIWLAPRANQLPVWRATQFEGATSDAPVVTTAGSPAAAATSTTLTLSGLASGRNLQVKCRSKSPIGDAVCGSQFICISYALGWLGLRRRRQTTERFD